MKTEYAAPLATKRGLNPAYTQAAISFLSSFSPLSSAQKEIIRNKLFLVSKNKGEYILKQGETSEYLYFIIKGVVVGYTTRKQKRLTTYICSDGDSVSSISGMYGECPSEESIYVLEDTLMLGYPISELMHLLEVSFEMNIIIRKILEAYYKSAHERSNIVRMGSAQEKYEFYISTAPHHVGRVPYEYIADFLNIKPKTLERILKEYQNTTDSALSTERCALIEDFMVKQQGFREQGLTLSKMAAKLCIPAHQLSYLINFHYKKSFNAFVNRYRVIYVRGRLQRYEEWQHLKIEALGIDGGFSSRSVFFSEFKQHVGMSPAEYAKSIQFPSPDL